MVMNAFTRFIYEKYFYTQRQVETDKKKLRKG